MKIKTVEDFYEYCANMGAQFFVTRARMEGKRLIIDFCTWDRADFFTQNIHE